MTLSTASNWLSNFIIAFIALPLFDVLEGGCYFLLMEFYIISGIFVWFVYPETAHRSLEDPGEIFGDRTTSVEKMTLLAAGIVVEDSAATSTSQVTLTNIPNIDSVKEKKTDGMAQIDI